MGDGSLNHPDSKGKGRAPPNGDLLAVDLNSAEEGTGVQNGGLMQMQMVEQQVWAPKQSCDILLTVMLSGPIYPIPDERNRIYRVDNCRTWANFYPASSYGRRAKGDRSAN